MITCYLGIGSNLGNRRKNIKLALEKVNGLEKTKIIKTSRLIETSPQGGHLHQRKFLNGCLKIKTELNSLNLLKKLKTIEKELGRVKTAPNGPRVIDLDILFYGDREIKTKNLEVPHPRIFEREFVLRPLMEVL